MLAHMQKLLYAYPQEHDLDSTSTESTAEMCLVQSANSSCVGDRL